MSNASPAASSIVPPSSLKSSARVAAIQARMAAADDQADAGKDVVARCQRGRRRCGPADDSTATSGLPMATHKRFGRRQADQQRAGQPGRVGHGHGVEIVPASGRPGAASRRSPAESARRGPARRSPAPRRRTARAARPAKPRPTRAPPAGRSRPPPPFRRTSFREPEFSRREPAAHCARASSVRSDSRCAFLQLPVDERIRRLVDSLRPIALGVRRRIARGGLPLPAVGSQAVPSARRLRSVRHRSHPSIGARLFGGVCRPWFRRVAGRSSASSWASRGHRAERCRAARRSFISATISVVRQASTSKPLLGITPHSSASLASGKRWMFLPLGRAVAGRGQLQGALARLPARSRSARCPCPRCARRSTTARLWSCRQAATISLALAL